MRTYTFALRLTMTVCVSHRFHLRQKLMGEYIFANTYCQWCLSVWCRFVLGGSWNAEVCIQPLSSHIGKVLALVIPFCVWITLKISIGEGAGCWNCSDRLQCSFWQNQPLGDSLQALLGKHWKLYISLSVLTQFLSNRSQYHGGWLSAQSG